jgi:hypothetical protein
MRFQKHDAPNRRARSMAKLQNWKALHAPRPLKRIIQMCTLPNSLGTFYADKAC